MKRPNVLTLILFFAWSQLALAQVVAFEGDPERNTTVTYDELIAFYKQIDVSYSQAKLFEVGTTDVGKPLHVMVLSADEDFDPLSNKQKKKAVLFVNNGIHPGEPEGIDVSMIFVRDMLIHNKLPKDVVICVIPVYNVAGMLNRGISRVNQNGPTSYGFRGSRQNYDLNRDFIKADTRNSRLFQQVFNQWDPDVLFDTHASNGADYQYIMTLIATQKDKLAPQVSGLMQDVFLPELYSRMQKSGYPMIPYVNTKGQTPESGLVDFLETPRYSSGYAALHHTIGFMPETHMWKPYGQRVDATYKLLNHLLDITIDQRAVLLQKRNEAKEAVRNQSLFPLRWALDTTRVDTIDFLGYEATYKKSEVTGADRLFYDRSKPKQMRVPYYRHYKEEILIKKPMAYILPQAYDRIVDLMKLNGVEMTQLDRDTVMDVEMYYITGYKSNATPYEGHYMHHSIELRPVKRQQMFFKGDWIVPMNQIANRYIIETIEPQSVDSFFNWNFFDAILSQKEYFSPYIFEDFALDLLNDNPDWHRELEAEKEKNPAFASNPRAQLDWIYKKSKYYESTHLLYPVARVVE